jgi:hypothetical protein
MEALKRRLNVLTSELAPAPSVALLGLPSPDELWALPSVVGLGNLLAAHRTVVCLRAATEASEAALRHVPTDVALVWLGDAGPAARGPLRAMATRETTRAPPHRPIVLMPLRGDAEALRGLAAAWSNGPPALLLARDAAGLAAARRGAGGTAGKLRVATMPDPAHALWGLLDQHPLGTSTLRCLGAAAWRDLVPPSRRVPLERAAAWLRRSGRPIPNAMAGALLAGSRRALEGARRSLTGAASVETDELGVSLLAALLGRPFEVQPDGEGAEAAAYWGFWAGASDAHAAGRDAPAAAGASDAHAAGADVLAVAAAGAEA